MGIYLTREMVWAANARNAPLPETVNGLYALLLDLGYAVDFVTQPFDATCELAVVVIPFMLAVSAAERQALHSYMERGGRVIAELPMTNLADCQSVGEWFGLRCQEWIRPIYFLVSGWSMNDAQGRFGGFAFHDRAVGRSAGWSCRHLSRQPVSGAACQRNFWWSSVIPTFALGRSYYTSFHRGACRLLRVSGNPPPCRPIS